MCWRMMVCELAKWRDSNLEIGMPRGRCRGWMVLMIAHSLMSPLRFYSSASECRLRVAVTRGGGGRLVEQ